jgi:hypothetical protein
MDLRRVARKKRASNVIVMGVSGVWDKKMARYLCYVMVYYKLVVRGKSCTPWVRKSDVEGCRALGKGNDLAM